MAGIEDPAGHAIPGAVVVEAGMGGLPRVRLLTAAATAELYLQGATVTGYQPRGGAPVLFLSRASRFQPGAPIRGGVPLVFPWFGPHAGEPAAPMHGFARTAAWRLAGARRDGEAVEVWLELTHEMATHRVWPHPYRLRYRVRLGQALDLSLEVENPGDEPSTHEAALHTYLAVTDVRQVAITGLAGTTFVDKVDGMRRKSQGREPIMITAETDRVYLNTTATCEVSDPAAGRRVCVEKEGSRTTVVWNPWVEKARATADLGDEEWQQMLCVETANALEDRLLSPPRSPCTLRARLSTKPHQQ